MSDVLIAPVASPAREVQYIHEMNPRPIPWDLPNSRSGLLPIPTIVSVAGVPRPLGAVTAINPDGPVTYNRHNALDVHVVHVLQTDPEESPNRRNVGPARFRDHALDIAVCVFLLLLAYFALAWLITAYADYLWQDQRLIEYCMHRAKVAYQKRTNTSGSFHIPDTNTSSAQYLSYSRRIAACLRASHIGGLSNETAL
jgi:hypothetical protein